MAACAAPAPADPIGGKVVRIIVPFGPGGSFDQTSRIVAPVLEKHLEEITGVDQTVIVENKPGAGGRTSYMYIWQNGPSVPEFVLMSASGIRAQVGMETGYDASKFTYIGRASQSARAIYVQKDLPFNTFEEMVARSQEEPILLGTSGFGSSEHQEAELISNILYHSMTEVFDTRMKK